jgi:hypothetical protein
VDGIWVFRVGKAIDCHGQNLAEQTICVPGRSDISTVADTHIQVSRIDCTSSYLMGRGTLFCT